ncbi:MAG: hypothetical protein K0Q90_2359 [Paenibacillaceae bacterium]|jgi:hypothetical protein|nr:hypothetical protein [Paenibacillaceae bacterium]
MEGAFLCLVKYLPFLTKTKETLENFKQIQWCVQ